MEPLPGTMRHSRVGFDTWARLWFTHCVCVFHVQYEHVYSYRCILHVHIAFADHQKLFVHLPVGCVYIYISAWVGVCVCVCLWSGRDGEHLPSSAQSRWREAATELEPSGWHHQTVTGRRVRAPVAVVGKSCSQTGVHTYRLFWFFLLFFFDFISFTDSSPIVDFFFFLPFMSLSPHHIVLTLKQTRPGKSYNFINAVLLFFSSNSRLHTVFPVVLKVAVCNFNKNCFFTYLFELSLCCETVNHSKDRSPPLPPWLANWP